MPYTPSPHIDVTADGPVTVITLNNPEKYNSLLDDMHLALQDIWWDLSIDRSVRAVVLTGAGKAFCSGGDIPEFIRNYEDAEYRRLINLRGARRLMDAMAEFPKPLVAAVNGPAIGLGCNLALMSDMVVMSESTYLADTHVSVGLVCGDGGAVFWPILMGLLRCKEYLLTGERIPAKLALEFGLANRVVPKEKVLDEALAVAQRLAEQPAQAIQETKRALNLHLQAMIGRVAPFALSAEGESFGTDDVRRTIDKFTKS